MTRVPSGEQWERTLKLVFERGAKPRPGPLTKLGNGDGARLWFETCWRTQSQVPTPDVDHFHTDMWQVRRTR